jgi:hypothetical protein
MKRKERFASNDYQNHSGTFQAGGLECAARACGPEEILYGFQGIPEK